MSGFQDASRQSIRSLLERYEASLVSYATRLMGDVEQARDVVQDTFLRFVKSEDSVRSQAPEVLTRWLFTTCRRRALDVLKKEQRMKSREQVVASRPAESPLPPSAAMEKREALSGVTKLLEELPSNQQEALRLKFDQGLSYQQIAEVMGQSLGHVGFLLHKGLHTLRRRTLGAEQGVQS